MYVSKFDSGRLFLHSPSEGECVSRLTLNLNLTCAYKQVFDNTTLWKPILIQYAIYTSVMWKLEAPSAQTQHMKSTEFAYS